MHASSDSSSSCCSDEDNKATEMIRDIIENGLATGKIDEERSARFIEFMKSTKDRKKGDFALRKPHKANKKHRKASDSSESSDDNLPILVGQSDALLPVVLSSSPRKNLLPDDTPIYEEQIDSSVSSEEDRELLAGIQRLNMREESELVAQGLAEIREQLDECNIPAERYYNAAWRSIFIASNTTGVLTEDILRDFIDDYRKAHAL